LKGILGAERVFRVSQRSFDREESTGGGWDEPDFDRRQAHVEGCQQGRGQERGKVARKPGGRGIARGCPSVKVTSARPGGYRARGEEDEGTEAVGLLISAIFLFFLTRLVRELLELL
jgi:hypothetical protein